MAKDRTHYFRIEARELLDALSRGLLDLERAQGDKALVARLLRHAHTLKGAARVVQEVAIGDLAHEMEGALGGHREQGSAPVPRERIDALLRTLDAIAARVAALDPAATPAPAPAAAPNGAPAPRGEAFSSVRVDVAELDALLESALEAAVQVTAVRGQLERLDHVEEVARTLQDALARRGDGEALTPARLRPIVDELRRALGEARRALDARGEQAYREIAHVRSSADRLRLLPARAAFGALERAARDAARSLEREVAFEAAGGDVRVEASVLAAVRDALLHLVRNAVAHGIEPAAERGRAGKPAAGAVRVEVERRGRRVVFTCRDDGRGVDAARVRAAAVRKGLAEASEVQRLDERALFALLLRGGISTSATVTAVAGRGVGLDVVRDTAARLGAEVAIASEPGRGTAVEIAVPAALAALTALTIEAGGAVAAVPLDAVRETLWLDPARIARTPEGAAIAHAGTAIPFVPLARVLGRPLAVGPRRAWSAAIVRSGERLVAIGADRVLGASDVVVRPLPACAEADPAIAGAAVDAEGNPLLVLDPAGLVAAAALARPSPEDAAPAPRAPILVVDDSLTTRMLEQSILESAGYEVELAESAEEALEKARRAPFGVFVVDVEMPGMDGFEFVRTTRADPQLSAVPAILVTSRAAEEDRRRGLEAGASAYIAKGEFDQARLLATIAELLR
jgi:two-component system chemotaxis sensor kinase CheA